MMAELAASARFGIHENDALIIYYISNYIKKISLK